MAQERKPYVFVGSIPNLYQLWQVLHTNSLARGVDTLICQSMLGATRTEAERQLVVSREQAFNQILGDVCAQQPLLLGQQGGLQLPVHGQPGQRPGLFHPSLSGQAALARVTWNRSWWPST